MSSLFNSIKKNHKDIHLLPIGGVGEFGMNMMGVYYNKNLYIIDAGVLFPDERKLGITSIIPSVDDVFKETKGVSAYIITHGHEDHIGALPYLLPKWPAPIYATPWTAVLIRRKLEKFNLLEHAEIITVMPGDHAKFGALSFEYFQVHHSIPDACSLIIRTPDVTVFHTGDFKIESDKSQQKPMNFSRLQSIGEEGVDLLLVDSTNAAKEGVSGDEISVKKPLKNIIKNAPGRTFISTFASNLFRLATIADICAEEGKKLVISGRSLANTFENAEKLGYYNPAHHLILSEDDMHQYDDKDLVILASGSQGEWRSVLYRMAYKEHKRLIVKDTDSFVFSSRVIPGNEKSILNMTASIEKQGGTIISPRDFPGIHVSGHACQDEIIKLIDLLQPKKYLPVHGGFSQLLRNKGLAVSKNISIIEGDIIEDGSPLLVTKDAVTALDVVPMEKEFVDQDSYIPLSYTIMRERLRIGDSGLAVISGVFNSKKKTWSSGPSITLKGLDTKYNVELTKWLKEQESLVAKEVIKNHNHQVSDLATLNESARISLRRLLFQYFKKKPVVIPQIWFSS